MPNFFAKSLGADPPTFHVRLFQVIPSFDFAFLIIFFSFFVWFFFLVFFLHVTLLLLLDYSVADPKKKLKHSSTPDAKDSGRE